MPICSTVVNAKVSDSRMLIPTLEALKDVGVSLPYLVADMGYIGGEDKIKAMIEFNTAVATEVKRNMIIPECSDKLHIDK